MRSLRVPKSQFELLTQVADGFRAVGKVEIGGTETTHYRGTLNIGAGQRTDRGLGRQTKV